MNLHVNYLLNFQINPKAPLEKACIISCGFPTGYCLAANAVQIQPGDKVALWGMGCIGLAAVIACKERGASKIIGIDVNPNKEAIGMAYYLHSQRLST